MSDMNELVHIRRCHGCGSVTEMKGALVQRCGHCGKPMLPFFYYDDFATEPYSEAEARKPVLKDAPIRGLTASW